MLGLRSIRWHWGRRRNADGCKSVVIVGSGFGGLEAVRVLSSDPRFNVTLISRRDHFEYTPGILRLFCDADLFWHMACPIPSGRHEFVLGSVTAIETNSVSVETASGSKVIAFDYIILAMGADYRQPVTASTSDATMQARSATWTQQCQAVEQANSVLILGGGAVGTELAAEIVDHYPNKQVSIVTGAASLVPSFPAKSIQHTQKWLRDRGAQVVLQERVASFDERSCQTTSGKTFEADLVFNCFGLKAQTSSIASGSLASALGDKQQLTVRETLQIEGHDHIFAVGDLMTLPSGEIKQAFYAQLHGKLAGRNVARHLSQKRLLEYPRDIVGASQAPLVAIVSLGRYSGSLVFNNLVITGFLAAITKWFIEWTKVQEMRERPVGLFVWHIGDKTAFFLSRCCCKPS